MAGKITATTHQINDSATASNNFVLKADNLGGLKLSRGNDGVTSQDILTIDSSGKIATPQGQAARTDIVSMVRLNATNGYGSTNTKIRRFTNVVTNQGSDITYADSATLGASFTVNTNGVYAIAYVDVFSATADSGLSLNTTTPTTAIGAISATESLSENTAAASNFAVYVGWTGYLPQGSIVRPHTSGVSIGTSHPQTFTITRVS